jgi:hypothetical protein
MASDMAVIIVEIAESGFAANQISAGEQPMNSANALRAWESAAALRAAHVCRPTGSAQTLVQAELSHCTHRSLGGRPLAASKKRGGVQALTVAPGGVEERGRNGSSVGPAMATL